MFREALAAPRVWAGAWRECYGGNVKQLTFCLTLTPNTLRVSCLPECICARVSHWKSVSGLCRCLLNWIIIINCCKAQWVCVHQRIALYTGYLLLLLLISRKRITTGNLQSVSRHSTRFTTSLKKKTCNAQINGIKIVTLINIFIQSIVKHTHTHTCLLYTSDAADER